MLPIGALAPDFELPLHTGDTFHLSSHRKKHHVILYFYPKDFTWGCTQEGCLFSEHLKTIQSLEGVVVGINSDSLELHRSFAEHYNLGFPLASDTHLEVCRNYRALWLRGFAIKRITYVIDKRGIIQGKAHHELLIDKHWEYVLRTLNELYQNDQARTYNRKYWDL